MFQRWNSGLTSALQLFWVKMITSLGKHSKLLSLRDTIFIDAQQQGPKILEVFTELLSFRESRCLSKQLADMDGWTFKINFNV